LVLGFTHFQLGFHLQVFGVFMQSQLIWNAAAGNTTLQQDVVVSALAEIGFVPDVHVTSDLEALDAVLTDPRELVIVAGGDGTLRQVVKRLCGRGVKLMLLPLGTANNFAAALGLRRDPLELIAALRQHNVARFDVGVVQAGHHQDIFLEGAGFGLFAQAMRHYGEDHGKSVLRALTALTKTVVAPPVLETEFVAELENGEHEEFVGQLSLLEVMNTPAIGPRLPLVPNADPQDGCLELLTIEPSAGVGFLHYAVNALSGSLETLENVNVRKIRRLQLVVSGGALHVDGDSLDLKSGKLEFSLEPSGIEVLLPDETENIP
jgi:diacylglycerol kinase (ATP)